LFTPKEYYTADETSHCTRHVAELGNFAVSQTSKDFMKPSARTMGKPRKFSSDVFALSFR